MTKKKFPETLETAAAEEQATAEAERVFDFTEPVEAFDDETKRVYFCLRRVAILAGDESRLPDRKTYTEAQVVEILGEDYKNVLSVAPKCCA